MKKEKTTYYVALSEDEDNSINFIFRGLTKKEREQVIKLALKNQYVNIDTNAEEYQDVKKEPLLQ